MSLPLTRNLGSKAAAWLADRCHRALLVALVVAAVNSAVAFTWAVPRVISPDTASSWAVDTIAPVPPLNEAYHRFTRTDTDGPVYPLFHYVVLVAAYAPYVALKVLTGGLRDPSGDFPYGVSDPEAFFGSLTLVAHAVSLAMALGIVVALFGITRRVFSAQAAVWSAFLAALLAPLAYYGKTSNLDVPYLFWTMLALWQYVHIVDEQRLAQYVRFGAFMALAVATKDQAYGFFVAAPFLFAAWLAVQSRPGLPRPWAFVRQLVGPQLLLTGAVAAVVFAVANNFLFGGWPAFVRHLEFLQTVYDYWSAENPERRTLAAQGPLLLESFRHVAQMLGYPTLVLGAAGIVLAARERNRLALSLLAFPLGYYIAVIAVAGVVFSRYMLGPALLLLPFAGAALQRGIELDRAWRGATVAAAAVALGWQVFLSANLNYGLLRDSRYEIERWIRANVPAGARIESQIQQRYLPRLADSYRLEIVGNSMDIVTYDVVSADLTADALRQRAPDYVLVLHGVGVTGDPTTMRGEAPGEYFAALLGGELGYRIVADFETPSLLPYKQVTSGTHPRSILLARETSPR